MACGQFVWYKRLDRIGEDPVDLGRCRRFFVTSGENPYGGVLIYYLSMEGDRPTWIKHRIYEDIDGPPSNPVDRILFHESHPEEVAHDLLFYRVYDGQLPAELEAYRAMGDPREYSKWREWQMEQSGSSSAGKDPTKPIWSKEQVGRKMIATLTYKGTLCKRFEKRAGRQWPLLDRFHDHHWERVKSPFDNTKTKESTLKTMNIWPDSPIRFDPSPGGYISWSPR